jgi:hypothetical protein
MWRGLDMAYNGDPRQDVLRLGMIGNPVPPGWPSAWPWNPTACASSGPPKCPHCGGDASGYANGPAHWCPGLAAAHDRAATADAIALLQSKGYRVIDPEAGR